MHNLFVWDYHLLLRYASCTAFLLLFSQASTELIAQKSVAQPYDRVKSQIMKLHKQIKVLDDKYAKEGYLVSSINTRAQKIACDSTAFAEDPLAELYLEKFSDDEQHELKKLLEQQTSLYKRLMQLPDSSRVYALVKNNPEPKNSKREFFLEVAKNLSYPVEARFKPVEGSVYTQFTVNEAGELTNFTTLKGIGSGCEEAVIEALKTASPWHPGTIDGQPVKVRITFPAIFKLAPTPDGVEIDEKYKDVEYEPGDFSVVTTPALEIQEIIVTAPIFYSGFCSPPQ